VVAVLVGGQARVTVGRDDEVLVAHRALAGRGVTVTYLYWIATRRAKSSASPTAPWYRYVFCADRTLQWIDTVSRIGRSARGKAGRSRSSSFPSTRSCDWWVRTCSSVTRNGPASRPLPTAAGRNLNQNCVVS